MAITTVSISELTNGSPSLTSVMIFEDDSGVEFKVTVGALLAMVNIPLDYMTKAEYDSDNNGVVNDSEKFNAQLPDFYLNRANHNGDIPLANVTGLAAIVASMLTTSMINVANGVAGLDANGVLSTAVFPFLPLQWKGIWDADTNTPTLADNTGTNGFLYRVTCAASPVVIDLGSGNISVSEGDWISHNGTIWQRNGDASLVQSVNGQTGIIVLTTADIADSAGRRYQTENQFDAATAAEAAGAGAGDRYALLSEVNNIVVGQTFLTPETFADGQTTGQGSAVLLTTLGYTNVSAALVWPRTAAAAAPAIDVNTMTIDWIINAELYYFMQETGASAMICPGAKSYYLSHTVYLPNNQFGVASNRRSQIFDLDWKGSIFRNASGGNMIMFDRYPADQTEATASGYTDYGFQISNAVIRGNNSPLETEVGIRLGATTHSQLKNIRFDSCGMGFDGQFCLEIGLENIKVLNYGKYGVRLINGQWSGATSSNAQSNVVLIEQFRAVNGSGKTPSAAIYLNGNHTIKGDVLTFEGYSGSDHHVFYENTGTLGTNICELKNIYMENAGCSRAGIRFSARKGYFMLDRLRSAVAAVDMPVLVEAEHSAPSGVQQLYVEIKGQPVATIGSKFRSITYGALGYGHFWDVRRMKMNDNVTLNVAANFETGIIANSYVPANNQVYFEPSPI